MIDDRRSKIEPQLEPLEISHRNFDKYLYDFPLMDLKLAYQWSSMWAYKRVDGFIEYLEKKRAEVGKAERSQRTSK